MKTPLFIYLGFFVAFFASAQDKIIKLDDAVISAKVIEITTDAIKYKKWENIDGPLYNIALTDVQKIVYENGVSEEYTKVTKPEDDYTAPEKTKSSLKFTKESILEEGTIEYFNSIASNAGALILSRCASASQENSTTEVFYDQIYFDEASQEAVVPIVVSWAGFLFHDNKRWVRGTLRFSNTGIVNWTFQSQSTELIGTCARTIKEIK